MDELQNTMEQIGLKADFNEHDLNLNGYQTDTDEKAWQLILPGSETWEQLKRMEITDPEQVWLQADYMAKVLGERIDLPIPEEHATSTFSPESDVQRNALFDYSAAWPEDIVARFAAGKPIEYRVLRATLTPDSLYAAQSGCLDLDKLGIAGSGIAQAINAFNHLRGQKISVDVCDLGEPGIGQKFTQAEQNEYVVQVDKALRAAHVLPEGAKPGIDVAYRRDSNYRITMGVLRKEFKRRHIVYKEDNSIWFMPNSRAVRSLRGVSNERRQELFDNGVCLVRADGTPTRPALGMAARLWDGQYRNYMQVDIRDVSEKADQESEYLLQYSLYAGNAYINYQPMTMDRSQLTEQQASQLFAGLFHKYARIYTEKLDRFADFTSMTPPEAEKYYRENYGRVFPEDSDIIRILARLVLPTLFRKGEIASYHNSGHGAFSYLDILLQPYLDPGAPMIATDIALAALSLALRIKYGDVSPEIAAIGPLFEQEAIKHGGDIYDGAFPAVLDRLINHHSLMNPGDRRGEKNQIDCSSFYDCSKHWLLSEFVHSVHDRRSKLIYVDPRIAMMRSLRNGFLFANSGLISLHMLRRDHWGDYPSTYLTIDDLYQAYEGADLAVAVFEVKSPQHAATGFDGMALVVAMDRGWLVDDLIEAALADPEFAPYYVPFGAGR